MCVSRLVLIGCLSTRREVNFGILALILVPVVRCDALPLVHAHVRCNGMAMHVGTWDLGGDAEEQEGGRLRSLLGKGYRFA